MGAVFALVIWVAGWIVARLDAGKLGQTQGEVAPRIEAADGGAHAVDGERFIVQDGMVECLGIKERRREHSPGSFAVVESNHENCVRVGKGAVPRVIVRRRTHCETAAVDCEEGGQEGRRCEIVVRGEEDSGTSQSSCGWQEGQGELTALAVASVWDTP